MFGLLGVFLGRSLPDDWSVGLEERFADAMWRATASKIDERRLIVVDIDERSLSQIGPWPWSRDIQAQLIERIAAAGAGKQVLDIVFADARPGDDRLRQAFEQHKPILAQAFALEQGGEPSTGQLAGALSWVSCPGPFGEAKGYIANQSTLLERARDAHVSSSSVGHITPRISADGLVRFQPAVICYEKRSYPALSIAALMRGFGESDLVLVRGERWWDAPWMLGGKSQNLPAIPLNDRGDIRIPWRLHPDSFVSISAADILQQRFPAEIFHNAWVLIGSSAFGLNDAVATPFGGFSAGLQVHAQLMAAMIDGSVPFTPRAVVAVQLGWAALGVLLIAFVARSRAWLPPYVLPVTTILCVVVLLGLHTLLLLGSGLWVGWLDPAAFIVIFGLVMGTLEHMKSRVDRDRLYTHLSSYLPAPVAAALVLQSPSNAIKASTRTVSVMVADIRNFSAYCEARPPEEAAAVLHAFFSVATRVVEANDGVVESFSGDAVFAVWNGDDGSKASRSTVSRRPEHPFLALTAANELLVAMRGVLPDPAPEGLEPLGMGIGVETGPAMSGSFGLASRRTHMVMGRTVTIAGRLVDMTADLAHPILVG